MELCPAAGRIALLLLYLLFQVQTGRPLLRELLFLLSQDSIRPLSSPPFHKCHDDVAQQLYRCLHFFIGDDLQLLVSLLPFLIPFPIGTLWEDVLQLPLALLL